MRGLSHLAHVALLTTSPRAPTRGRFAVSLKATSLADAQEGAKASRAGAEDHMHTRQKSKDESEPTMKQVLSDFRDFYANLAVPTGAYKRVDATRLFQFVSPPAVEGEEWFESSVLNRDEDLMASASSESIAARVSDRYGTSKPILLYLPGLDGTGISSARFQFDDLSRTFEFWRLSISVDDRTGYNDLVRMAVDFVDELASASDVDRPIYLMGESFGGLLAPTVALRLQKRQELKETKRNPLKGLVLVNPATSFETSDWDLAAPILTSLFDDSRDGDSEDLPSMYATVGSLVLSALVPSTTQIQRLFGYFSGLPTGSSDEGFGLSTIQNLAMETGDSFKSIEKRLPGPLIKHRVNWLMVGSAFMSEQRLSKLEVPTLVVSGQDDAFLKSAEEAKRLSTIMPNCETLLVPKNGHFVMDDQVNVTEAIIYSKLDPLKEIKPKFDPVLDWKLPSPSEIAETFESTVKPLEERFSPVYMSTDSFGRRAFGLGNLPKPEVDGPLLFVANHQLLGQDLNLFVPRLIQNGIVVRGLAHPLIFSGSTLPELGGRTPGLQKRPTEVPEDGGNNNKAATNGLSIFQKFGAVQVNPKNYYKVLQTGQNALLFPGGTREVFHGKDEAYQLFWPEKVDFVRTAARFNATIVPLSAVGMADSVNFILSSEQLTNAPFVGDALRQFAGNITAARFDTTPEEEFFTPPLVIPSSPSRNYFVFGKPVSTADLDPKDKQSCKALYMSIQDEMNRGFQDILRAREKDPFMEATPRQTYERLFKRQAPTFGINEMNSSS